MAALQAITQGVFVIPFAPALQHQLSTLPIGNSQTEVIVFLFMCCLVQLVLVSLFVSYTPSTWHVKR